MSEYQQWNCQPQSLDKNTNIEIRGLCFASLSTAGGWQDVTLKGFLRKFLFLLFVCFSLPGPPHRALWPGATCLIYKSPQKGCPFLVEVFWGILIYKGNSLWKKSSCKSRKCLFSHLIFFKWEQNMVTYSSCQCCLQDGHIFAELVNLCRTPPGTWWGPSTTYRSLFLFSPSEDSSSFLPLGR